MQFYPQRSPGQAVVTGVVPSPPRYVPSFLSRMGFSIPHSHCWSILIAPPALALSANQFLCETKSPCGYEYCEVPLQSGRKDLQVRRLFRYFGSCWDLGTGGDPTQPQTLTLTLTLTLTINRNQKGPKLSINAAAPRLHRTRKFLNCGRRFRSADRATQFQVKNIPIYPFSHIYC